MTSGLHFDNVVSLGGSCKTAYEARAYFDFGDAYPFDWYVSKAGYVAQYLSDPDPEGLYDPDNMTCHKLKNGSQIASKIYDFRFHHEFSRDLDTPGHPVIEGWINEVDNARSRHLTLLRRLLEMNSDGRRILFIRTCEFPGDGEAIPSLVAALAKRFDKAAWKLLVINSGSVVDDDRVIFDEFPLNELRWDGKPSSEWENLFSRLNITCERSAKRFDRKTTAEGD